MNKIAHEVNELLNRSTDSHIRVGVTGLSRAGKTAFITSLVNQLIHTSSHKNLPLFKVQAENRLLGARRVAQQNLMVPKFSYDEANASLQATPSEWPIPTRDVSEIRLALRYKPKKATKKLLKKHATLYVDIVDYPGEWLLDLPLLKMSYEEWSEQQLSALDETRTELASRWIDMTKQLDPLVETDEKTLETIAQAYTEYLHTCKTQGYQWIQPGRFVLPGDLAGAPVLQFFPVVIDSSEAKNAKKEANYTTLKARFEEYKNKVVKGFYKNYFATFDRQIVLVDVLTSLNNGHHSFVDTQNSLHQIMASFKYGRNGLLRRLFSPKTDKLLFAATKADHVTPEQHSNVHSLMQQLVQPIWQHVAFENIEMECVCVSAIKATTSGFVSDGHDKSPALKGVNEAAEEITLFPGEVPNKLPTRDFWQQNSFNFVPFKPSNIEDNAPYDHIRMDKIMQFLLGDKLR
jgi:predicted YcjX-like family ATPase